MFDRILAAARRIVEPQRESGEHETGDTRDEEGLAPAEIAIDKPTDDVAERRADGNGGEEYCEHTAPPFTGEIIGQESGGDAAVRGFTNAHRRSRRE